MIGSRKTPVSLIRGLVKVLQGIGVRAGAIGGDLILVRQEMGGFYLSDPCFSAVNVPKSSLPGDRR